MAARLTRGLAAALLVCLALVAAGPAAGGGGPPAPGVRVQLPPRVHFFVVPLEPVRQGIRGGLVPSLEVAYSNILQVERARGGRSRFDADLELATVAPQLAWRPADRLDLAIRVPVHVAGSGFLDRTIREYHDAFGFDRGGRELWPNDAFASRLVVDGRLVYEGEQRPGVGDVAFTQSLRLAGGTAALLRWRSGRASRRRRATRAAASAAASGTSAPRSPGACEAAGWRSTGRSTGACRATWRARAG